MYRPQYGLDSSITFHRGAFRFAGLIAASALFASLALLINGCDTKSAPITKPPAVSPGSLRVRVSAWNAPVTELIPRS